MAASKASTVGRLWFPLLYVFMFSSLYVWAFHEPLPRQVPVAVVGTSSTAGNLAGRLQTHVDGGFDVHTIRTDRQAKAAVYSWRVRGAYDPAHGKIYTATMMDPTGTSAAKSFFQQAASRAHQRKPRVVDLAPAPTGDPRGLSIFYVVIAWTIGGFLTGIMLNIPGGGLGLGGKFASIAGFALVGSALSNVLAAPVFQALPSTPLITTQMIGVGALMIAIPALLAVGTRYFLGMLPTNGLIAAVAIFLDFPAAGDAVSAYMVPIPFRVLNQFMPGALASREGRAIMYFGGSNWAPQLFYLLAWVAAGLALIGIGYWWRSRPRSQHARQQLA
jgi:hypothetical protein